MSLWKSPWASEQGRTGPWLGSPWRSQRGRIWLPSELFKNGEQGAWYDPSDLSTLFQDAAGTTPVTADGDPVGLMLDKSRGLVLGPELVTNGTFDAGLAGWTQTLGSGEVVDGRASFATDDPNGRLEQFVALAPGSYEVSVNILSATHPNEVQIRVGSGSGFKDLVSRNVGLGLHKEVVTVADSQIRIGVYPRVVGGLAVFDNISVRELPGNHASQSVSASRPVYRTDATLHWLEFDGVDDYLVTPTIEFSSGPVLMLATALEKESDVTAWLFSTPEDPTVRTGGLGLLAPSFGGDNSYRLVAKYTGGLTSAGTGEFAPAPDTAVITGLFVGGSGSIDLRRNGGLVETTSGPAYPFLDTSLTIGDPEHSDLPFTGKIYASVIRSANSTTSEVESVEQYLAKKSGVQL